jgi:hypothetical protein
MRTTRVAACRFSKFNATAVGADKRVRIAKIRPEIGDPLHETARAAPPTTGTFRKDRLDTETFLSDWSGARGERRGTAEAHDAWERDAI